MPPDDDDDLRRDDGISERRGRDADRPRRRRREEEDEDDHDERDYRRRPDYADETGGLIPYKNGWALASYYLGVFALIPCVGLVLGILAVIFGFLGVSHAKQYPESKGTVHAIVGITLGVLVVVGHLLVIGLILLGSR